MLRSAPYQLSYHMPLTYVQDSDQHPRLTMQLAAAPCCSHPATILSPKEYGDMMGS